MPKSEIQSVEVSYFVHATEDETRLIQSVGEKLSLEVAPQREELRGHFGNRIVHVRYHVTGDKAENLFTSITSRIDRADSQAILDTLHAMMDEHRALYLRLNKQQLLSGKIALAPNDPVRVKVKPRSFMIRGDARKFYARIMGLSQ